MQGKNGKHSNVGRGEGEGLGVGDAAGDGDGVGSSAVGVGSASFGSLDDSTFTLISSGTILSWALKAGEGFGTLGA